MRVALQGFDGPLAHAVRSELERVGHIQADDGDRLVVCGDFNVEPESETFQILAGIGLTDLVTTRGFTSTRTAHYGKPGRFADYMLVDGLTEPVSFEVVRDPVVSDHCPLVLEI